MQLLILFFKSCIYNLNSRNKNDKPLCGNDHGKWLKASLLEPDLC